MAATLELPSPCFTCGHLTAHRAEGPKDLNGFRHDDQCEQCDCINDPTFDLATGIRYCLGDHAFKARAKSDAFKWPMMRTADSCAHVLFVESGRLCGMPEREHPVKRA